jgi:inhibitor of KinA
MHSPWFKPVADCALLVEFGYKIDDRLNRLVIALDQAINAAAGNTKRMGANAIDAKGIDAGWIGKGGITGVIETVPALVNLLVVFDPLATTHAEVENAIRALLPIDDKIDTESTEHRVAVCYDPEICPDLTHVAQATGLSVDAVIEAHASSRLRVSMYGFAPGYAYLSGLPECIQIPRKATAVRDVPKGSVSIAGPQSLITTITMPTGWSLIGRSPTRVLRTDSDRPFLFDVGDTVVFERIRRDELPAEMQVYPATT